MATIDETKLNLLKRINRLQYQVLELNPEIVTKRDLKNLRKTVVTLDNTLEELINCIETLLEGREQWHSNHTQQS